jgi:hypothetical protein
MTRHSKPVRRGPDPAALRPVAAALPTRELRPLTDEEAREVETAIMDYEDDVAQACLEFFARTKCLVIAGVSTMPIVTRDPNTHRDSVNYRVTAIVKRLK